MPYDPLGPAKYYRDIGNNRVMDGDGNILKTEPIPQLQFPPPSAIVIGVLLLLLLLSNRTHQQEPAPPQSVEPQQFMGDPAPVNFQLSPIQE